jgi:hypothetical protein
MPLITEMMELPDHDADGRGPEAQSLRGQQLLD